MPPKKKDKDGGKSKKSSPSGTVNAAKVSTFDASHLEQVTELLMKAKQLRNYFQLERDSVDKYWHVTLKEVENARYQLANIDQEIEHLEDRHLVEMRVYRQKVRHLLYEHKETVRSIRASAEEAEQESIARHRASLLSLRSHKGGLHGEIQSIMLEHEAQMKELREGHRLMLDRRHKNHERMMKDAQSKLENKMEVLKEELDLRRRAEIHDLEERKNAHINELLRRHETAFQEMKKYYNEITANNLDLIKCLKDEISNMKKNEEHNENLMYEIAQENKGLNTPLCDAKKAVEALRADLHNYDKDKLSLKNARNRLILLRRQHQDLCAENEALKKSFVEVEKDREDLLMRFERVLHEAKEKASRRCYNLEQQLSEMMLSSEQKDAQLTAVLSAAKLEPAAMESITRQLEDLLDTKNRAIKDLHFELRKVETTHQDVVAAYERRCAEAQLPPLDLDETLRKFRSQEN